MDFLEKAPVEVDRQNRGKLHAILDGNNPEHAKAIIQVEMLNDLSKQLILMTIEFYEAALELSIQYNEYHSNHEVKDVRSNLMDIESLRSNLKF